MPWVVGNARVEAKWHRADGVIVPMSQGSDGIGRRYSVTLTIPWTLAHGTEQEALCSLRMRPSYLILKVSRRKSLTAINELACAGALRATVTPRSMHASPVTKGAPVF
jgi:hypothetical protein